MLARIEGMLLAHLYAVVPNSLLGKALHYLSTQYPKLSHQVENGDCPIDNNLGEYVIRPFVVGRRNWLLADTAAGAHASANSCSRVETCKANGVDPYACLASLSSKPPRPKPPTTSNPSCLGQTVADGFRLYIIASAIVNDGVNSSLTKEEMAPRRFGAMHHRQRQEAGGSLCPAVLHDFAGFCAMRR